MVSRSLSPKQSLGLYNQPDYKISSAVQSTKILEQIDPYEAKRKFCQIWRSDSG